MFDIVQTTDAIRHSVMKGDKVLAPTSQGSDVYAPGTVIDGQEGRQTSKGEWAGPDELGGLNPSLLDGRCVTL